ncbi:MAG: 30S ribosome-binding factor RbfA [Acidobacteriota bacterium]
MHRTGLRRERLAHAMREVLSELLLVEMKDPRLKGVVVSAVELSGDLKSARAYFSVYGDEERVRQAADGLLQARGALRHEMGKRMRVHSPPELEFLRDKGFERSDRVHRLLDEISAHRDQQTEGEVAGDGQASASPDPLQEGDDE